MPFHRGNYRIHLPLIVTGFCLLQTLIVQAQQIRSLSVTAENDIYAPRGQDRHYSNGVRLNYSPGAIPETFTWLGSMLGNGTSDNDSRYDFVFGQNIYTPEYDVYGQPASNDRPFAGWLYTGLSVTSHQTGHTDYLTIHAGIVGPAALGRQSQNLIHKIVDDPELSGWENQLANEPGLLLRYRRSWFFSLFKENDMQLNLVPALGFSLGNIMTDAAAALSLQLGNQPPGMEVPSRLDGEHAAAGGSFPVLNNHTQWMLFASVQQRAVLRNIFLDGNTFSHSASVSKRNFIRDYVTGFAFGFGQFHTPITLSFNLTFRGREFELQRGTDSFGSITLGIQY